MYFPLVLAALVIVSAAVLLRQYFTGSLDDGVSTNDAPLAMRDDDTPDALKAA